MEAPARGWSKFTTSPAMSVNSGLTNGGKQTLASRRHAEDFQTIIFLQPALLPILPGKGGAILFDKGRLRDKPMPRNQIRDR